MRDLENDLIIQATRRHKKIFPCADKQEFSDCFTRCGNKVLFWYNTEDNSTHVMTFEKEEVVGG
jgi:hypothetical protein